MANFYGEFDTDKYIKETFFNSENYKGTMIEVGAGPTTFYSMSKHFRESGWRCICIEPNPKFVKQHLNEGNEIHQLACSNFEGKSIFNIVSTHWAEDINGISYSGLDVKYPINTENIEKIEVEVIKLDTLLSKLDVQNFDFVSVDVEGSEMEVIEGLNLKKYKPKVILLENYEHNPLYVPFMEDRGYVLHKKIEYNYIFSLK